MNGPPTTITEAECEMTVESYLGTRQQRVAVSRSSNGSWFAVSRVIELPTTEYVPDGDVLDNVLSLHPGLAFRQVEKHLEVYTFLVGQYEEVPGKQALQDIDKKLVEYLAHAADRLEFELAEGADIA